MTSTRIPSGLVKSQAAHSVRGIERSIPSADATINSASTPRVALLAKSDPFQRQKSSVLSQTYFKKPFWQIFENMKKKMVIYSNLTYLPALMLLNE